MDQLLSQVRGFSFGGMTYAKGGLFGQIMRPYLSLVVIDRGACTISSDMGSVRIGPGEAGILAGRTRIEFSYPENEATTVSWCEGFLPELPAAHFEAQAELFAPVPATTRLKQLQEIGVATGHGSSADLNSLRDAIGLAVCRCFLLDARRNLSEKNMPPRVLMAKRFMEDRCGDDTLNVNAIAQHVSMSPQHLIASFKTALGTTPGKYLWQVRSARARQMLVHTKLSQAEVAYQCGYKSVSHFSRALKNRFGVTPGDIRRDMGFAPSSAEDSSVEDLIFD